MRSLENSKNGACKNLVLDIPIFYKKFLWANTKKVNFFLTTLILFLLIHKPIHAQEGNNVLFKEIDGQELKEDLSQIRRTILQSHPNPFVYVGKRSWDSTYLELMEYFEEPKTLYDFIFRTSDWLSQLKDSHVGISLMDLLYNKRGGNPWLDFKVTRINNKFYAEFFSKNSIPFGNEIIEINSVTIDTLFKQSLFFSLQEGDSFGARELYASEQIQVLYNLLYATSTSPNKIPVKHINHDGDTLFTFVETVNFNRSRKKINQFLNYKKDAVEYSIDSNNKIAFLKINSFYPINKSEYTKAIDRFFDTLTNINISKLLIDIRSNSGGYFSCVNYLFNYIDTTRTPRIKNFISKRSRFDRFESSKNPWMKLALRIQKTIDPSEESRNNYKFYNLPLGSLDTISEFYNTRDKFLDKKYLGKCYLAINGTSISASVDCASWFRQINRGIILGESCMGPLTGTCGNPISFYLNNTNIEVLTSTMRSYTDPKFLIAAEAITPDVVLRNSLENFRNKTDIVHEYLIKNEK